MHFLQTKHEHIMAFAVIALFLTLPAHVQVDPFSDHPTNPIVNNNTTIGNTVISIAKSSPTPPKHIRIAVGGSVSSFTPEALDKLKSIGVHEIHVVVPDAGTYPDLLKSINDRGMTAVYDGEQPFLHNRADTTPFSQAEIQQLKDIRAAGWEYFSSEGLFGYQVKTITDVGFRYISYGGEQANDLYAAPFSHAQDSHYANCPEAYDTNLKPRVSELIYSHTTKTPSHNGVLFGLWTNPAPASGGPNPLTEPGGAAKWIKSLNAKGANITEVVFWCGVNYDPLPFITGVYKQEFDSIKEIEVQ